jgi:hypothetical protein
MLLPILSTLDYKSIINKKRFNQRIMKIIKLIILICFVPFVSFAQDVITTKKGEDINAKILEVSLSSIKYKKFDNLNGPIYNILITDILLVRYQNGTKDLFGNLEESKPIVANESQNGSKEVLRSNSPITKPNETIPAIKEPVKVSAETNQPKTEIKKESSVQTSSSFIEEKKSSKPEIVNETVIKTEAPIKIKPLLTKEFVTIQKRKTFWLITSILFSSVGTYSIIQSNSLYNEYKSARSNAGLLREQVETLSTLTPIAFGLSGISMIGFIVQHKKQSKVVKFSVQPNDKSISGANMSIKYTF